MQPSIEYTFAKLVVKLAKDGAEILENSTALDCHLNHMCLGIAGEVGELIDAVKKYTIYRKPMDAANIVEELGDLEFYLEGLRSKLGLSREEVLAANMEKLNKRYASGSYSDKQAQERADKQ